MDSALARCPGESPEGVIVPKLASIPPKRSGVGSRRLEPGFGERPAGPGELLRVPAVQLRQGHTVLGRMDEPAVSDVDAHVADLGRLRARAFVAEEDDVGGLEAR